MLCFKRWAESRSVEMTELAREGILGRRNRVGKGMKRKGRYGKEKQAGRGGWNAGQVKGGQGRGAGEAGGDLNPRGLRCGGEKDSFALEALCPQEP